MNRQLERHWPELLASALTLTFFLTLTPNDRMDMVKDLSNPILNIFAIIVGFIATALALLVTAQELEAVRRLRMTSHFNQLVDYHWSAICLGLFSSIISLMVMVMCKKAVAGGFPLVLFHVWIFASVWTFAAFFRVVKLLRSLLRPAPPVSP